MKQKKTARFSDSGNSASALKVQDSKQSSQIVTAKLESQQKEGHMNTNTTTNTEKAQTVAKTFAGIALAVLITKGTHYAVTVIDPSTGRSFSKTYTLKTHGEAVILAEKMYNDRKLVDIVDASPEAK